MIYHLPYQARWWGYRLVLFCIGLFFVLVNIAHAQGLSTRLYRRPNWDKLVQADRFYTEGASTRALEIQRQVKPKLPAGRGRLNPISDPKRLSTKAQSNWRLAQRGIEQKLETKVIASLEPLTKDYPEFIPAHVALAKYYSDTAKSTEDKDKQKSLYRSAIQVLERGFAQYSTEKALLDPLLKNYTDLAKVDTLQKETELYLLASIAARQFGIFNPKDKDVPKYNKLADDYLQLFRKATQDQLTSDVLAGLVASTNSKGGILRDLMVGESTLGSRLANDYKKQITLIQNEKVNGYIKKVGDRLGTLFGRKDMEYEFNVYDNNNDLNAFVFPGGKVFLASGMLKSLDSEAQLAGLLAHEMAHAVLSHSTLKMTSRFAASAWADLIPLGDVLFPILQSDSEKGQEEQADILGTRVLAAAQYPADGLLNVMEVLAAAEGDQPRYSGTHPATKDRLNYLRNVINTNKYDTYRHERINGYVANVIEPLGGSNLLAPSERKVPNNTSALAAGGANSGGDGTGKTSSTATGWQQETKDNVTLILDQPKPLGNNQIALRFTIDNTAEKPEKDRKSILFRLNGVRVIDETSKEFPITWKQTSTIVPEAKYGQKWSGNLVVSNRAWNKANPNNQGLIFELIEASVGSRLFRIAF